MIPRIRLPLIALALSLPAPALAQSAQDFQLPPAPAPSASPQVEGPVDEESGPVPVRPRAIPTARPTQRPAVTLPSPTPTATAAATPAITTQPSRRPATSAQPRAAVSDAPPIAPRETPPIEPPVETGTPPGILPPPLPTPSASASPAPLEPAEEDASLWPWLLGLGLLAALGAGGYALWRRRVDSSPPPEIEPPLARATGAPLTGPLTHALSLRAEAVKLTRSFAYATLDYRLTVINRTDHAMSDLAVAADLVSANGQAPMDQQVALPGTVLPVQHTLARLSPGQSQQLKGQVRLPIGEARVIRQGRLPLLVPLLRVRIDGPGEDPLARTFVIGQGVPDGGRLQPFRLDEGPRSYQPIAQRALD